MLAACLLVVCLGRLIALDPSSLLFAQVLRTGVDRAHNTEVFALRSRPTTAYSENPHAEKPHTEKPRTEKPRTENAYSDDKLFKLFVRRRPVLRVFVAAAAVVTATVASVGTAAACVSTTLLPSADTASAIAAAVYASPLTSAVPPDAYTVADVRLARSNPTWALVDIQPLSDTVGPAVGLAQQTSDGWQLAELGTYEVGCDIAPAAVRDDLGISCPPPDLPPPPA